MAETEIDFYGDFVASGVKYKGLKGGKPLEESGVDFYGDFVANGVKYKGLQDEEMEEEEVPKFDSVVEGAYEDAKLPDYLRPLVPDGIEPGVDRVRQEVLRIGDRINLGISEFAPRANAAAAQALSLATRIPELPMRVVDAVSGTELVKGYQEKNTPGRMLAEEALRSTARAQEFSEAGKALGGGAEIPLVGGTAGDLLQEAIPVTQQAILEFALSGGTSPFKSLAAPAKTGLEYIIRNATSPVMKRVGALAGTQSGLSTLNQEMAQWMEKGAELFDAQGQAIPEAALVGVTTAVFTQLGGMTGAESVLKESGAQGLKQRIAAILKEGALQEAPEEMADEAGGQIASFIAEEFDASVEKAGTMAERLAAKVDVGQLAKAGLLGGIVGSGITGIGQSAEAIQGARGERIAEMIAPVVAEAAQSGASLTAEALVTKAKEAAAEPPPVEPAPTDEVDSVYVEPSLEEKKRGLQGLIDAEPEGSEVREQAEGELREIIADEKKFQQEETNERTEPKQEPPVEPGEVATPQSGGVEANPPGETVVEGEGTGEEVGGEVPAVSKPAEQMGPEVKVATEGTEREQSAGLDVIASWDEDSMEHQKAVREFMRSRIAEKRPIFPNRSLGFEYAADNSGLPRGLPSAAVAIANLQPGDSIRWRGKQWAVDKTSKSQLTIKSGDVIVRIKPPGAKWEAFVRDMDGELIGHAHGALAPDLMRAWLRDPISNQAAFAPLTTEQNNEESISSETGTPQTIQPGSPPEVAGAAESQPSEQSGDGEGIRGGDENAVAKRVAREADARSRVAAFERENSPLYTGAMASHREAKVGSLGGGFEISLDEPNIILTDYAKLAESMAYIGETGIDPAGWLHIAIDEELSHVRDYSAQSDEMDRRVLLTRLEQQLDAADFKALSLLRPTESRFYRMTELLRMIDQVRRLGTFSEAVFKDQNNGRLNEAIARVEEIAGRRFPASIEDHLAKMRQFEGAVAGTDEFSGQVQEDNGENEIEEEPPAPKKAPAPKAGPVISENLKKALDDEFAGLLAIAPNRLMAAFPSGEGMDPVDSGINAVYGDGNAPLANTDAIRDTLRFRPLEESEIDGPLRARLELADQYFSSTVGTGPSGGLRRGNIRGMRTGMDEGPTSFSGFARGVEELFGKRVVFVAGLFEEIPSGFTFSTKFPETLFLNVEGKYPAAFLLGHEFGHSLQAGNSALYAELSDFILSKASDWSDYAKARLANYAVEKHPREFVNDFIGSQFNDATFWKELAGTDGNLFERTIRAAIAFLNSLKSRVSSMTRDVRPYFDNIEEVRRKLAEALLEYRRVGNLDATWGASSDVELVAGDQENTRHAALEAKFNAGTITEAETEEAKGLVDEAIVGAVRSMPKVVSGDTVDGLVVRDHTPNQGSVRASIDDPEFLGFREFPMSWLTTKAGKEQKLADAITESGEINPLIVVVSGSEEGPAYVLEGAHRIDALATLGKTSFPAQVVFDSSETAPFTGVPLAERFDPKSTDSRHATLEAKHNAGTITEAETAEAQALVDAAARTEAESIRDQFTGELLKHEHEYYGIRAIDGHIVKVGQKLRPSNVWNDGDKTREKLAGTSSVGITDYDNIKDLHEEITEAMNLMGISPRGFGRVTGNRYLGDQISLIGGPNSMGGEDIKESIIVNAKVVSVMDFPRSADPFTGVPLAERFDPKSDSTLRAIDPKLLAGPDRERFSITALVQLLREFGNYPTVNTRLVSSYGRFVGGALNAVQIRTRLLWDKPLAARVLGHEIGHFIDLAVRPEGKGKRFHVRWQPLVNFKKEIELRKTLKDAARALSRDMRGDFVKGDPYRDKPTELFADAMSAILTRPAWTKNNHPLIFGTFQRMLDGKPDFKKAYDDLTSFLRTGELDARVAEQLDDSIARSIEASADLADPKKTNLSQKLKQWLVSKWHRASQLEQERNISERKIDKLEDGELFAARVGAIISSDLKEKVQPFLDKIAGGGMEARKVFGRWLTNNRVVKERRAAGQWLEQEPAKGIEVLQAIIDLDSRLEAKWQPQLDALKASPTGDGVYDFAAAMMREVSETAEKSASYLGRIEEALEKIGDNPGGQALLTAFNVRGMLLNPSGITPESAQAQLDSIEADLTPEEFTALQEAARNFFDIVHERMVAARRIGLISTDTWTEIIEPNRYNYVPFAVMDYFEGKVGAGIKAQYGTTKDIVDPYMAAQLKMGSLHHWMQRQMQVLYLQEIYDKAGMALLPTRKLKNSAELDKIRHEGRKDDTSRFTLWQDGKAWLIEFPEDPGKSFETASERPAFYQDLAAIYNIAFTLPQSLPLVGGKTILIGRVPQYVLQTYTTLSPSFLFFRNVIRSLRTDANRIGWKARLKQTATGMGESYRLAANYAEAAFGGAMLPEVKRMVETSALPPPQISRAFYHDPALLNEMLLNGGITALQLGNSKAVTPWVKWRKLEKLSAILESQQKIQAYLATNSKTGNPALSTAVARRAGIPNPGVYGQYSQAFEMIFPWTRVMVQGLRSSLNVARDPELGKAFLARTMITEMIPRIAMYAIASGLISRWLTGGDDDDEDTSPLATLAEFFRRTSPYKMAIDNLVPLGWYDPDTGEYHPLTATFGKRPSEIPQQWQAWSLRMPSSEEGKMWGGLLWNILSGTSEKIAMPGKGVIENAGNWLAGNSVQLSPAFEVAQQQFELWIQGRNSIDSFRNMPVANPDMYEAGGMYRVQANVGALFNQFSDLGGLFGGISQMLGLDPRALDSGKVRPGIPAALKSLPLRVFSFDNYAAYRGSRAESIETEQNAAKARMMMSGNVRALYDFYFRNLSRQDELTPTDKRRFEAARGWKTHVWKDKRHPSSYSTKTLQAAAQKNNKGQIATLTRDLDTVSQPYVSRFQNAAQGK